MSTLYEERKDCRACGGPLEIAFSLGRQPLNAFLSSPDECPGFAPVTLTRCADCGHVQLGETVNRDALFRTYYYRSSTQPAMVESLREAIGDALIGLEIEPSDTALLIGVNDGTEARLLPKGLRKIGFDPARNLADEARTACDLFVNDYFPSLHPVGPIPCKLIVSNACLYDIDDLPGFVSAVKDWLAPDGRWLFQVSFVRDTMEQGNVGDLTAEHLSFFSLRSIADLLERANLSIARWSHNDVNGGSLRVVACHGRDDLTVRTRFFYHPSFRELQDFGMRLSQQRDALRTTLIGLRDEGVGVIGLGASTKGNLLLSYAGIGPDILPAIADRDPRKHGKFTVTGIPIITEDEARARKPDVFFVLIPQFLEALKKRERPFLERGGRLLLAMPMPHFVSTGAEVAA